MNIARLRDPSTLLCAFCCRIQEWDESGLIDRAWLPEVDRILTESLQNSGAPELRDIQGLLYEGEVALAGADANATDFDTFLLLVSTLQRLDLWHEQLLLPLGPDTDLEGDHEDSLERLINGGGYNLPEGTGTLIPPGTPGVARAAAGADLSVVARFLHYTAYLPPSTGAGDPDDSSAASSRTVELRYAASLSRHSDGRGEIGDQPVIAISPVLQDLADANVTVRTSPDRYGVEVCYDPARLRQIVASAITKCAHLLFMPEMTVSVDMIDALAEAIRLAAGDHVMTSGDLPALRYVVAGVSGGERGTGGNFIVVFDIEGREILRQDKLCRWNLKPHHQRNYQLNPACADGEPDLKEDIEGGRVVWIADLEQVGRFLTLICADMDYDKPGDWLLRNVAVDWLHAPIMDKSIAWSRDTKGDLQPWIVARAHRAAALGVPKVVVTNSLLLSLKLNQVNSRPGSLYPVLKECSIAFMLDSGHAGMTFRQLTVPLPSKPLVVQAVKWCVSFKPFPPPL